MRLGGIVLLASIAACSSGASPAPTAARPPQNEASVPEPLGAAACRADHERRWPIALPTSCAGRRTCIDERKRYWVDGRPFFPRGVYNGGFEYERVLENCPASGACRATQPANVDAYVRLLADAGFNLIQERSRNVPKLLDAIHAEPRMKIAHLLWSDPFTKDGHDAMVADIRAAAADPSVVMWFGPDEIDLNAGWSMAAGIRRILRGAGTENDALLAEHAPGKDAFVPPQEPANDPLGLPFQAALAFERGLVAGHRFYDALMPITYPFTSEKAAANDGEWGTWRTSEHAKKSPVVPVLQMIGIPEMDLVQPTAAQIRAQIASSIVNGATGAFYYTMISDKPQTQGRKGWFAADDTKAWAAFSEMHALEDALAPVLFGGDATEESEKGKAKKLEWRTWKTDESRVTLIVNPTARARTVSIADVVQLAEGEHVRTWTDCALLDGAAEDRTIEAYGFLLVETVR